MNVCFEFSVLCLCSVFSLTNLRDGDRQIDWGRGGGTYGGSLSVPKLGTIGDHLINSAKSLSVDFVDNISSIDLRISVIGPSLLDLDLLAR